MRGSRFKVASMLGAFVLTLCSLCLFKALAQQVETPDLATQSSPASTTPDAGVSAVVVTPTPIIDAANILKTQGLAALLEMLEQNPQLSLPDIHTQTYVDRLPSTQKQAALDGITFGLELYQALKGYQRQVKEMPLQQFEIAIRRLSFLASRLWESKKLGGVAVADLIDRVIFARLVSRAVTTSPKGIQRVDALRTYYKHLVRDWRTVVQAIETEFDVKLDKAKIGQGKFGIHYKELALVDSVLERQYIAIADQFDPKGQLLQTVPEDQDPADMEPTPDLIKRGHVTQFLGKQIEVLHVSVAGCARTEWLRYSILMIKRARAAGKPLMQPSKDRFRSSQPIISEATIAKLIPEIIGKKALNCGTKGFTAHDFLSSLILVGSVDHAFPSPRGVDITPTQKAELQRIFDGYFELRFY